MPNPRDLNWVLGSVGHSLDELSRKSGWKKRAPPHIQSLVINKGTQMPGPGFDSFLAGRDVDYGELDRQQKRLYLNGYWADVFAYPYWRELLSEFDLVMSEDDRSQVIAKAKMRKRRRVVAMVAEKALSTKPSRI
ncbi:hypothetical protein NCHU2750_02130 [Neorhizobium sp. NCHU2750]|nr:hypothetical protein NCHU2750_02130 [Neorhizobium sp. NCHU2750]